MVMNANAIIGFIVYIDTPQPPAFSKVQRGWTFMQSTYSPPPLLIMLTYRVLQKVGEFAVTVRNMGTLLCQSSQNIRQRRETAVYTGALPQSCATDPWCAYNTHTHTFYILRSTKPGSNWNVGSLPSEMWAHCFPITFIAWFPYLFLFPKFSL